MILRKFFSVLRKAEAIQRLTIEPFCQFVMRQVRMRTPACGLSMMLVVARQRCNEGGTPSRLMVKHSSSPSSRLVGAETRVDGGPQSLRAIDDEQPLLLRIDAPRHDVLQQLHHHGGVLRGSLADAQHMLATFRI